MKTTTSKIEKEQDCQEIDFEDDSCYRLFFRDPDGYTDCTDRMLIGQARSFRSAMQQSYPTFTFWIQLDQNFPMVH